MPKTDELLAAWTTLKEKIKLWEAMSNRDKLFLIDRNRELARLNNKLDQVRDLVLKGQIEELKSLVK